MGIVVSAVATGLVHNIACSKETESREDKVGVASVEVGVETDLEAARVQQGHESPQRIRTPGYPQILISSPSGRDSVSKVNKDLLRETELPPPPPPSRLYPPLAGQTPPPAQIVRTAQVIKHKQTLNNSSVENNDIKSDHEIRAKNDVTTDIKEVDKESEAIREDNETKLLVRENSKDKTLSSEKLSESELLGQLSTLSSLSPMSLTSLPIVSLLPTLTEEITLTLERSGMTGPHPGWFRRNYTSIDTVQKIYGTHPRYLRDPGPLRRPQTRVGGTVRNVTASRHVRCNTSMSHGLCQDGCYSSPRTRGYVTSRRGTSSLASSPARSEKSSKSMRGKARNDAKSAERRKLFAKTGLVTSQVKDTRNKIENEIDKEILAAVDS